MRLRLIKKKVEDDLDFSLILIIASFKVKLISS